MKQLIFIALLGLLAGCGGQLQDLDAPFTADPAESDAGLAGEEIIPLGLSFRTLKDGTYLQGGISYAITWYIKTDPDYTEFDPGFYLSKLEISKDGGATWEFPTADAEKIPGSSDEMITYTWLIPDALLPGWEGANFKARVTVINTKGNVHQLESSAFVIDNHAPQIVPGSLTINGKTDSPLSSRSSSVKLAFQVTDELSPISHVCMKMNSSSQPLKDDSCWKPLSILNLIESKNLDVTGLNQLLGFVGGAFSFYVWAKDAAGNMTTLSNGGSGDPVIDMRVINYTPGNSVSFTRLYAANTDTPTQPPAYNEINADATHPEFVIKWGYTILAGSALDATNPLKLEYSTDELNYTLITDQLVPGANGACSFAGTENGCYVWTVPTQLYNSYLRIRLSVKDDGGFYYSTTTQPLNTGKLRALAGNTNQNIGGSAAYAMFSVLGGGTDSVAPNGQFAVADDGRIFILDQSQGVLVVSPSDGSVKVYLKFSSSAQDGYLDDGTGKMNIAYHVYKIALDYSGRLLIMERQRIRRVILKTDANGNQREYLETIVGAVNGSINNRNATGIDALKFAMWNSSNTFWSFFTPLPNGDIYFNISYANVAAPNYDIRVYKASKKKVYPLILQGTGVLNNCVPLSPASSCKSEPYREIASDLIAYGVPGITFNPNTSWVETLNVRFYVYLNGVYQWFSSTFNPRTGKANGTGTHIPYIWAWGTHTLVTSRKGELYGFFSHSLVKYNSGGAKWERILGNGAIGQCADGTLATACRVDLQDVYITSDNVVFFLDRGRLRTIAADRTVVTVLGQSRANGDNGDPLQARFGDISYISRWGVDDKIVVADFTEHILREVVPGSTVTTLAGDRSFATTNYGWSGSVSTKLATAASLYLGYWSWSIPFAVDSNSGEPYVTDWTAGYGVMRLNRSGTNIGKWSRLIGKYNATKIFARSGTSSCDGLDGLQCRANTGYVPKVLGFTPEQMDAVDQLNPGQLLVATGDWVATSITKFKYCYAKSLYVSPGLPLINNLIDHFIGNDNDCDPDGSVKFPGNGANMSLANQLAVIHPAYMTRAIYYPGEDAWLMAKALDGNEKRIVKIPNVRDPVTRRVSGAGSLVTFANLPLPVLSFNYAINASGGTDIIYCSTSGTLNLYSRATSTNTKINLPYGMSCAGKTIEVSADGTRVIFPYTQNKQWGIADYYLGP